MGLVELVAEALLRRNDKYPTFEIYVTIDGYVAIYTEKDTVMKFIDEHYPPKDEGEKLEFV